MCLRVCGVCPFPCERSKEDLQRPGGADRAAAGLLPVCGGGFRHGGLRGYRRRDAVYHRL